MSKKLSLLLCFGVFISIVGIFFYPMLLQGNLPVPSDSLVGLYHPWRDLYAKDYPRGIPFKNFLITDPIRQQIPWRKIAIDQWKQGQIPKWNPYNFSGTPLAANVQAAVFYPLNMLFFIFDFPIAWTILILLEPLLAGIFLFFYLRHLDLDPLACLLGALAWSFSGFSIAWLTWGTMVHVALWLPLVLLSIDKLIGAQKLRQNIVWLLVLTFGLAMQIFAGHMQIAFYLIGLALCYTWYRTWRAKEKKGKVILWILFGMIAFAFVTSIQWVPMRKLVFESGRIAEVEGWTQDGWFIPWQHLIQFLAPDFFGNPTTLNYWGVWNYGELVGYIGIIPLLFATLAFFGKRTKDIVFWIAALIVALLFVLPTPFAKLSYQLRLPILSALQPTRLMVIIDFSLVMLASIGLDSWLHRKEGNRWGAILLVGAAFIILWLVVLRGGEIFQVSKRNLILPTGVFVAGSLLLWMPLVLKKLKITYLVGVLLVGITAVDLLRFGWKFTPFTPREYFFPETQTISFLKQQEKPFRVISLDKRILPPNVSSYYGIETIEGYDPLISERYEELMAAIARGKPDISPPFGFNRIITLETIDSPLLAMFNIRYVLSLTDIEKPFLTKVFQEGETRVYEYMQGLPRAYMVNEVRVVTTNQEALNALFDPSFNPANTAVIVKDPRNTEQIKDIGKGDARVMSYAPDRIVVETRSDSQGFLVLSQNYTAQTYSYDWHVTIDKQSIRSIYRTNYNFMGVLVPKGAHTVEFSL